MTPMIDVVFLLLIFFVVTFKIIVPEGDFNVQMSPKEQVQAIDTNTDSVQIRLIAHANGSLSTMQLNGEDIEDFDLLRQCVSAMSLAKPDLEIELWSDEHLRYEYVIRVLTAVSTICDKITFVRKKGE